MRQAISLPSELLEAAGEINEAKKVISAEIKEMRQVIREGERAGKDMTKARGRLESLQERKAQVQQVQQAERLEMRMQAQNGISARLSRLQSGLGNAARVASGGLGVGDIGGAGGMLQGAGRYLMRSPELQRVGVGLSRAGGAVSTFASAAGGAIIAGAALAITVGRQFNQEYQNRRIAAEGTADVHNRLGTYFRRGTNGSSTVTFAKMQQLRMEVDMAGSSARAAVLRGSPLERFRQALGFTQSKAVSDAETEAQMLKLDLFEASRIYGSGIGQELEPDRALIENRARRRMRREDTVFTFLERADLSGTAANLYFNAFSSDEQEAERVAFMRKKIEAVKKNREDKLKRYATEPRYDLNRLFNRNRQTQIRLVESDRRTRRQFWGMT